MGSQRYSLSSAPQGLYEESATQLAPLGSTLLLNDGREFVYCQNAAVALEEGRLIQSAAPVGANHDDMALDTPAAGTKVVNVTPGATGGAENLYAEGYFITSTGTTYKVAGHPAITASTAFNLTLADPLYEAIAGATTGTLMTHPCKNVIVKPASVATGAIVGVPIRDITASNFFWAQRRGICGVLGDGALAAGTPLVVSDSVAGALSPQNATYVVDEPIVGIGVYDAATTEVSIVQLLIP